MDCERGRLADSCYANLTWVGHIIASTDLVSRSCIAAVLVRVARTCSVRAHKFRGKLDEVAVTATPNLLKPSARSPMPRQWNSEFSSLSQWQLEQRYYILPMNWDVSKRFDRYPCAR